MVTSEGVATQPLLKFAGMKGVACLAWQPFAASQLAVGCSSGVLLWTVDPASVVSRPSSSCVVRCSYVKYLTSILFSGWRDCKVQQRLFVGLPTENWWPPAHHPTQGFTFGVQPHRSLNHQHSLHFSSHFRLARLFTGGAEVVLSLPAGVPMRNVSSLPPHPQSSECGKPKFDTNV